MTNRVEPNNFSVEQLCDSAIAAVEDLVSAGPLIESQIEALERNIKHLELFDSYAPAESAVAAGRAALSEYTK